MHEHEFHHLVLVLVACVLGLAGTPGDLRATWPTDPSVNLPIATNPFTHTNPQIITDGAGGAIIVWEDLRLVAPDSVIGGIFAQRVSQGGNVLWAIDGVPVGLATQGEGPLAPQIVSDGDFGGIVVWEDNPGADWDVYAQRISPFGEKLWAAEGIAICSAAGDQGQIELTSDGEGGAIITWVDFRGGYYSDVYAQRVDRNGNVLWALDGLPVCTATRDQTEQKVVADGVQGSLIVWKDDRNRATTAEDIFVQRIDGRGIPQWSADGVPVCTLSQIQAAPTLVEDGAGGALIVWEDWLHFDILAQRIDSEGNCLWTPNGVGVCTAPGDQHEPEILADGNSGAYVCWTDGRNDNADVYVDRIDGSGSSMWGTNGMPIGVAIWVQNEPEIVSDGQGGAIIAWWDSRDERFAINIYAQRMDPDGHPMWPTNGVAISTAYDFQYLHHMVPDNQGGAIITWEDTRAGDWDRYVYAQRVDSTGTLSTPTGIEPCNRPSALELYPPVPNPFSSQTVIKFTAPEASLVSLTLYDVRGRRVRALVTDGTTVTKQIPWDGRDDSGGRVAAGVYFCRLTEGSNSVVRRVVLLR